MAPSVQAITFLPTTWHTWPTTTATGGLTLAWDSLTLGRPLCAARGTNTEAASAEKWKPV